MNALLLGIVQDFSFATGETQNYLKLELPNGTVIQTAVDESTALSTMQTYVGEGQKMAAPQAHVGDTVKTMFHADPSQEAPSGHYTPVRLPDDPPVEFGGIEELPEDDGRDFDETKDDPEPPVPHWAAQPPRVTRNGAGYPVVHDQAAVDTGELVGDGNADEDGIGSI